MVFLLFRLKDVMAKRRRLRKSDGGDLEVHKQNVASSDQAIAEENVIPRNQLRIVVFSHQAIVEQIVASWDHPIGEQNVAPLELRLEEQNVASSEMKIENWCNKQFMWIKINKDDNL